MKKAWQSPIGVIRDICPGDPVRSYHPDVAALYDTDVPDDAVNGATLVVGVWTNPLPPPPPTAAEIASQETAVVAERFAVSEVARIAGLWQAAHDYEYAQISGSAIGLVTLGVIQATPKCLAVQSWIKSIWTAYYLRKESGSTDANFEMAGPCPHSVPELMAELGV